MKRLINCVALIALLLGIASLASADVVVPKNKSSKTNPGPSPTVRMGIYPDQKATEARLEIPRSVFQQLKAEIDGDGTEQLAAAGGFFSNFTNPGNSQTAMAGIFLSLAFAFGGVWLLRSRKQASKLTHAQLGVAILALCAASASVAYANAGPPPVARSLTSKILIPDAKWYGAYGQVKVVVQEEGDSIKLVLPKPKDDK